MPDRGIPPSGAESAELLEHLKSQLKYGKSLTIYCRQGVRRAGMIAAPLLTLSGLDPDTAVKSVSAARGVTVLETTAKREWIASAFAHL